MTGIVSITYRDTNNTAATKNLPNVNPAYLATYDSDVASTNATKINTATKSLMNLTTNTIVKIQLTTELDITSYVENQEG